MDIGAWFVTFFDGQFLNLLVVTLLLFGIMLVTWWLYRTLSKRNIFALTKDKDGIHVNAGVYILKYFFIFPVYSFLGFLLFSFCLFLVIKPASFQTAQLVLFAAIAIVSAIRISAYVNELLAEDLAKLIPLSVLSVVLTHPQLSDIGLTWSQVAAFLSYVPGMAKYLLFTILLEVVLRVGLWLFRSFSLDDDT